MSAALMIGAHLAVSACCSAASASGVCCSRGKDEAEVGQTAAHAWSANVSTAAALSLATTSFGVPLGA